MQSRFLAGALAAVAVISVPSAAFAGKRDTARTTIAAAKAKVDMNEKNGITGEAANIQSRARTALEEAQHQFDKSEENAAIAAGRQADALAEQASATQRAQAADATAAAVAPQS